MKRYRIRVAVQRPTLGRNAVGEEIATTWSDVAGLESVPAVIIESNLELKDSHMTPVTTTHRIILAGRRVVDNTWSVLYQGVRYDIIKVEPTVGARSTILHAQLVVV